MSVSKLQEGKFWSRVGKALQKTTGAKSNWKAAAAAIAGVALTAGAGAAVGASNFGGPAIGAVPGAVIGGGFAIADTYNSVRKNYKKLKKFGEEFDALSESDQDAFIDAFLGNDENIDAIISVATNLEVLKEEERMSKELFEAAIEQDAVATAAAFDASVRKSIADKLDARKAELAANVFGEATGDDDEEELDVEDDDELDEVEDDEEVEAEEDEGEEQEEETPVEEEVVAEANGYNKKRFSGKRPFRRKQAKGM